MTGPCADETKGWRLACVAAGVAGQSPACLDGHLAALLAGKRSDGLCIGVAGGSGSGKTTIAQRLRDSILPLPAEIIGLDRFFKPIDQMPRYFSAHHAEHRPDFNTPQSLRVDEMLAFARQVAGQGIVILDGHFALYFPQMRELMHIKVFVDIGLAAMLHRRTERNLAIGYGGDRQTILAYNQECVVPRHLEFILPTRQFADVVIPNGDSSQVQRDEILETLARAIRTHLGPAQR